MENIAIAKDTEFLVKLPEAGISKYQATKNASLAPLPNGRPIAANTSEGIDALLGFLD